MDPTPSTTKERPFRVCESCGRLTPKHLPRCVECGEASVQAMAEEAERASEERFARAFFTRGAPATWALIGANVAVFVLMFAVAKTANPGDPRYNSALVEFGAKVNRLIAQGEYWRLVTPMFIHIGLPHLLVNMYSLYAIGPQVERLYGTARFLILYLVSGFVGVLASYLFPLTANGVSAGASGALFGLLGVLFVFGWRYRAELPGVFRQAFNPRGLVPVLLLNLFITFAIPFIDKGAHLGGLAAGAMLAAVIPYFRTGERRAGLVWRALAAIVVAGTLACFAFAWRSYEPVRGATAADLNRFVEVYNRTDTADAEARRNVRAAADGSAVPPDAAPKAAAAAKDARTGAGIDPESSALMERNAAQLDRAAELLGRSPSRPTPAEADAYEQDAKALEDAWAAWLKNTGESYGITTKENPNESGGNDGN
jgi:membrane associated rhomboid family serine protease